MSGHVKYRTDRYYPCILSGAYADELVHWAWVKNTTTGPWFTPVTRKQNGNEETSSELSCLPTASRASPSWTVNVTQLPESFEKHINSLVDDDDVAHGTMDMDDYGWFDTLCGVEHPGLPVLRRAITCIACLVKHA